VNSAAITDLATTAPNTPKQNVAIRWQNIRDLRAYLEVEKPADRIESQEWLGLPELAEERITLGLRMQEGVYGRQLKEQYGYTFGERQLDWISLQSSLGTFAWDPDKERLRLTQEGLSLADHLTAKLLSLH
jgi:coproporphyrinogen III oxidase-like Fe-S oxidoreductase